MYDVLFLTRIYKTTCGQIRLMITGKDYGSTRYVPLTKGELLTLRDDASRILADEATPTLNHRDIEEE